MATLAQSLKKNNQLLSTSAEEAQQLTGGVPVTSPLMSATLGSNPDSAKMTGTPNQKTNALRTMVREGSDQATQEALAGPRTQATAKEKKQVAGATDAQGLSGLQAAVQAAVTGTLQSGLGTTLTPKLVPKSDLDDIQKSIANEFVAAGTDVNKRTEATRKLSKQLSREATQSDVDSLFGGAAGQAGATGTAAAGATANDIFVTDLIDPVTKTNTVLSTARKLLGNDADFSKMTASQLLAEINQEIDKEYSTVENMTSQMADPSLGAVDKAQIRKELRDKGAVGITSAETTIDKLADSIVDADVVKFNGKDFKTSELLNDDYVAGVVSNYLTDPTSITSKELEKNEPALVGFIKKYGDVIGAAVTGLGSELGKVAAEHTANLNLANIKVGDADVKIAPDIMKILVPNYDAYGQPQINPSSSNFLTYLNAPSTPAASKTAVLDAVKLVNDIDPTLLSGMKYWSTEEFAKLIANNSEATTKLNQHSNLKKIDAKNPNPEDVAAIFGQPDAASLQTAATLSQQLETAGLKPHTVDRLITDKSGNINYGSTVSLLQKKEPKSLRDILSPSVKSAAGSLAATLDNSAAELPVFKTFQPAVVDGIIDGKDTPYLTSLSSKDTSDILNYGKVAQKIPSAVKTSMIKAANQKTAELLPPSLGDVLNQLNAGWNDTGYKYPDMAFEMKPVLQELQMKLRNSGDNLGDKYLQTKLNALDAGLAKHEASRAAMVARREAKAASDKRIGDARARAQAAVRDANYAAEAARVASNNAKSAQFKRDNPQQPAKTVAQLLGDIMTVQDNPAVEFEDVGGEDAGDDSSSFSTRNW